MQETVQEKPMLGFSSPSVKHDLLCPYTKADSTAFKMQVFELQPTMLST